MLSNELILETVKNHQEKNGKQPTMREIAAVLGCSHVAISKRYHRMNLQGIIQTQPHTHGIIINPKAAQ